MRQRIWRIISFFDWRFLVAFGFVALVLLVGMSWRTTTLDNQAKDHRIDRLIAQNDREQHASSAERRQLLAGLNDVQAKLDTLVAYLNRTGTYIPPNLLDNDSSNDNDSDDGNDSDSSSGAGKQSPTKSGSPSTPANPGGNPGGGTNTGGDNSDGGGNGGSGGGGGNGNGGGNDKPDKPSKPDRPDKATRPSKHEK